MFKFFVFNSERTFAAALVVIGLLSLLPAASCAEMVVAYVTDLEGSRQRFERFMAESEAFYLSTDGKYHLRREAHFVFGGDAPDRYLGSRWVVAELVRLKLETPERVALLLGNRDIGKMRLTTELSPSALSRPPIRFFFTNPEIWRQHAFAESRSERLKYILAQTMGAPQAFELQRHELAIERNVAIEQVSDDEVAWGFLHDLGHGGTFRRFIELGQLAHRIGNTLFVHGGVTEENVGLVPDGSGRRLALDQWIGALNEWMRRGVRIWSAQEREWSGEEIRAEQAWLDYPMPEPGMNSKPGSVVTGRNNDRLNNPYLPPSKVIRYFREHGIERLVVGHTPTGDFLVVLRTGDETFEVVSADNSYARGESFATLVHFRGPGLRHTIARGWLALEAAQTTEVFAHLRLGEPTPLGKRFHEQTLVARLAHQPETLVGFRYAEKFLPVIGMAHEKSIEDHELSEPLRSCAAELESTGNPGPPRCLKQGPKL